MRRGCLFLTTVRVPLTMRVMEVSRRERPPWLPERGQRVRVIGTLAVPEWAGFTIVVIFALALLIAGIVVL